MDRPGAVTLQGKPFALAGPELKVGDQAPDFSVVDTMNRPVTLAGTGNKVRLVSVVPSLDTPVCDAQTRRLNMEAAKFADVDILTISMDLPFAQKRWCTAFAVDRVKMLSDHRDASFGLNYGTLIKGLRLESRAIFIVDRDNVIRYVEYVKEITDHPDYGAALAALQSAAAQGA